MTALSRAALLVLLIAAVVAVIAIGCGGGDDGGEEATPTATAAPSPAAATRTATATATPTPTPTPTATPAATRTPTPAATPTPLAMPASLNAEGIPYSVSDLVSALAPGGIVLTDLYDPASACAGAAVEGLPFVASEDATAERFAVWVLWVYPDSEARSADWQTGQRAEPLVEGCEPPNGFIYWHGNLLLWFAGFYGPDLPPASPPVSREEVREHAVIRAFLGLTR